MPPRRAASAKQRLLFSQRLTKDSKLTTAELTKRLKALQTELEKLDQETTDTESLNSVRKELIAPALLVHKDKGVKALVACCLADMLRLYAPDAPYTEAELKDIFQFFFRQLKNLSSSKEQNANQAEYFYLIESLANVQSIVLVTDINGSEELMTEAFRTFFDVVSTEMTKNIPITFADLLHQILMQANSIPASVLEALLAQFHPSQIKRNPAAYRLAADVASACDNRLQRDVCRYFSEILLAGANALGGAGDEEEDEDKDASDLEDIKAAHALIQSLHKAAPGVLLNVIPQLQEELQVDNLELRLLAVQTLADMIAATPVSATGPSQSNGAAGKVNEVSGPAAGAISVVGPGDIPTQYRETWRAWLKRSKDKAPQVRTVVVDALPKIWASRPLLSHELGEVFVSKLEDPDEKVRIAACRAIGALGLETALHHVQTGVLKALAERFTDKRPSVQEEAFKVLGRLYSLAYSEVEDGDALAVQQFGWIPQRVISTLHVGDHRVLPHIERCLYEHILPLPKTVGEEGAAVERLLVVAKSLDQQCLQRLKGFTHVFDPRPSPFDRFLDACEANNGGTIDENVDKVKATLAGETRGLAGLYLDPSKASTDLTKFAAMNDQRIYKLLRTLSDPQTDFKTLIKAHQECLRRLSSASPSIVNTFVTFLHRSSYLILNRSSLPSLLNHLRKPATSVEEQRTHHACAKFFLDAIAKGCPMMMRHHAGDLAKALAAEDTGDLAETALLALSQLVKKDDEAVPADKRMVERATHFAVFGSQEQAKCAGIILALGSTRRKACAALVERLAKSLAGDQPAQLVAHLSALAAVAKHAVEVYDQHSPAVTARAVQLLTTSDNEEMTDEEWVEDADLLDITRARVLALKTLTNRCLAYADTEGAKGVSEPVFKLLWQLLETRDQIGSAKHSPATASRLRLMATSCLLKLATHRNLAPEVEKNFETLAWTAQDPCYQVREAFINKLVKYLRKQKLASANYNIVLFLVAHDPDKEIVEAARQSAWRRFRMLPPRLRTMGFELIFVRLLHLLAHHPDFTAEPEDVITFAKYIEFYLECIANQDNVPLLYHLASKLKSVRDAISQSHTNFLYILSELAQYLIKARAGAHGWSLTSYPGSIKLPHDIFRPLPGQDVSNAILKKTFLPEEVLEELKSKVTKKEKAARPQEAKKIKEKVERVKATPKKRKSTTKKPDSGGKKKMTKRRRKDWEGEEDDIVRAEDSPDEEEDDASEPVVRKKDRSEKENETRSTGTKSRPRAKPSAGAIAAQAAQAQKTEEPTDESELSAVDPMDTD